MPLKHEEELLSIHEDHPLTRSKSNSITEHYSILRSGSITSQMDMNLPFEPQTSPTSSSISLPLPSASVLNKKVASTSTSIKSFIKKNLFNDQQRSLTEGPVTKLARSASEGNISLFDTDQENLLSLDSPNKLGYANEILLEPPKVPEVMIKGLPILRITRKKRTIRIFKIDLEQALVTWNNGKVMSIDNIQQIRMGQDAENYREEYGISKENEETWVTIIYTKQGSNKLKALHLIARNKEEFEIFVSTLTKLVSRRRELMKYLAIPGDEFANIHWRNYISKKNKGKEFLSFDDILKLTKRLHINCDDKLLLQLFKETDIDNNNSLNFNQFQNFVKKLKTRPEITEIFTRLTKKNNSNVLNLQAFKDFIRNTQKQNDPDELISKLFLKYSENGEFLTLDNFTNYLTSSYVSPIKKETEDLTRPLNEYFISSSHNTYLIGRQFGSSSSSIEGYIKALQRGCRSIELDIWDGDQGPVIRHGKLTGSINIRDVLQIIRKYAFIFTPYPLFLSFEIHCKVEYQFKVKDLILEAFGDVLVIKPLLTNSFSLPSPMDLKHRIVVKVKRTVFDDSNGSTSTSSSFTSSSTVNDDGSNDDSFKSIDSNVKKKKKKMPKIIPELSALGVYASGLKFTNFSLPESKTINHVFSFSESTFNAMIKDPEKDYLILKHNRRYFMRLYPSGYRYNSTNFSPVKFWNYGVQMVATNWQTYDIGQEVNDAMFRHGKGSGYVLKPNSLRDSKPNTKFKLLAAQAPSIIRFKIEIISGQLLPRPSDLKQDEPLSPYVAFELIEPKLIDGGIIVTDIDNNYKTVSSNSVNLTRPAHSNGFNPVWNFRFEGRLESSNGLDFIRLRVKTGEITFAVNCIKLDYLNQGYRHIPLYDLQGEEYIFSTLFINVSYEKV